MASQKSPPGRADVSPAASDVSHLLRSTDHLVPTLHSVLHSVLNTEDWFRELDKHGSQGSDIAYNRVCGAFAIFRKNWEAFMCVGDPDDTWSIAVNNSQDAYIYYGGVWNPQSHVRILGNEHTPRVCGKLLRFTMLLEPLRMLLNELWEVHRDEHERVLTPQPSVVLSLFKLEGVFPLRLVAPGTPDNRVEAQKLMTNTIIVPSLVDFIFNGGVDATLLRNYEHSMGMDLCLAENKANPLCYRLLGSFGFISPDQRIRLVKNLCAATGYPLQPPPWVCRYFNPS